jgi:hypothetical protein
MKRSDQFKKSRAWLQMHTFAITKSLREKLESVQVEDREGLCFIQNQVIMLTDEYDEEFAHISTRVWKDKLGTGYNRFINQLIDWDELEINRDHRWSKNKSGYPMSYAVPLAAKEGGTCIVDFKRKRIRLPRPKNKPSDAVSQYALECLSQLRVVENLVYPPPKDPSKDTDIRKTRIKWHCQHIFNGDFSLRYGNKVKRLFHRVLAMPSEGRCNLYHVSGFPLAEYDVKTCHPFLMLKFFTKTQERARYAEMLSGDIYSQIGKEMKIDDREQIKKDFQRVCNSSHKTSGWMAKQPIFQFYHHHFPTFAEHFIFQRKDLAAFLQNFEASLLVKKLGAFCREQNLYWFPMHDGFIARMDQGGVIADQASKIIMDAVGLKPKIEPKPLNT